MSRPKLVHAAKLCSLKMRVLIKLILIYSRKPLHLLEKIYQGKIPQKLLRKMIIKRDMRMDHYQIHQMKTIMMKLSSCEGIIWNQWGSELFKNIQKIYESDKFIDKFMKFIYLKNIYYNYLLNSV